MLDTILPLIKKPIRYTGGEYNITLKTDAPITVGIAFPDIYEIGMSNLGIKVIQHLFNQEPDIQCERIFSAWPDFGDRLKADGQTLYGLETKRPAKSFDLLGISLQSELNYTNVLYLLDLCGIPRLGSERGAGHPILIAGGPACLNPMPLSPVFDCFLIGDGEEAVPEIGRVLRSIPRTDRAARIKALAGISGVWVPAVHGRDQRIRKRVASGLTETGLPSPQILPICDVTHDRLGIEVMRGCTWGCRFCQSGFANRPLRVRPAAEVLKAVEKGIRETGWEEVSLLSFSILDYPDLPNLIRRLNEMLRKKYVSISLPAMRGELFSEELGLLLKEVKKTGLTFAPETASETLRRRLNKHFSNEDLIASIATAYRLGWKQVKLYFMIGLPFEQPADVAEIGRLVGEIASAYPRGGINISVAPFVPKPHTPFEGADFPGLDELRDRIQQVRKIKRPRVEVKYQDPEVSFIEAVLSRGDDKLFPVIESVYGQGGLFEEWREGFDFGRWQKAFAETGVDPRSYFGRRESYPWDFVDLGVTKDFLRAEFGRAEKGELTPNCYHDACADCGACEGAEPLRKPMPQEAYIGYGRYPRRQGQPIRYRIKYSIGEPFRYASHLDITRTIYRALRRSDLPVQFTQGFSPIPKVSFCPPKSVGQISKGDFFDLFLEADYSGNISRELNARFPAGIRILEVRSLPAAAASLSTSVTVLNYEIGIDAREIVKPVDLTAGPVTVTAKSGVKDLTASVESIQLGDATLACGLRIGPGMANVYDLLAYLTGRTTEEVRVYKVTRTSMFTKKDGILQSPMEVK